ncbi:MAG: hypothetical protein JRJ82_10620, partial [Deltaproteobacteria bacterium]|nr:hypothetical protein [Deltaproteobacteria bacterium]
MREKIIIVVMALAILYGALEFLIFSPSRKAKMEADNQAQDINKFVAGLTQEMATKNISGIDRYVMERAEAQWRQDLFFDVSWDVLTAKKETSPDEEVVEEVSFIYSGYMEMGRKRTAIISGMEYVPGDELVEGQYVVRAIYPNRVVLEKKEGKVEIILPLVEGTL